MQGNSIAIRVCPRYKEHRQDKVEASVGADLVSGSIFGRILGGRYSRHCPLPG